MENLGRSRSGYKVGDLIGGEYKVINVLGGDKRSGMGVVYVVTTREFIKPIVLKTFQTNAFKKQFLLEAEAWIHAGAHQNIVQAFWAREIDQQLFVAAEYVMPDEQGRNNLSHFLSSSPLQPEIALFWAVQFCQGISYAQSKNVSPHRDIKPENLLIEGNGALKITDFGLARYSELQPLKPHQKETDEGGLAGTLPYMAPEQFLNEAIDHRADIYSFGIVLYRIVSGNLYPYVLRSNAKNIIEEFLHAHTTLKPKPVESPLMPIIAQCLEKKPQNRYQTFDSFFIDLSKLAKKLGVSLPKVVLVAKEDEELYSQAQSYVALGNKEKALKAINEYVSKYPENYVGWTEKVGFTMSAGSTTTD